MKSLCWGSRSQSSHTRSSLVADRGLGFSHAQIGTGGFALRGHHLHATGLELLIVRSKSDQEGVAELVSIPHANGERCPVKALKQWQELTGIRTGWLPRSVDCTNKSEKPLSAQSVALIVKDAVRRVGGDPSAVSGHSLRAGYCTQAAIAGLQPLQIRDQTGHTSDLMPARYIRPQAVQLLRLQRNEQRNIGGCK